MKAICCSKVDKTPEPYAWTMTVFWRDMHGGSSCDLQNMCLRDLGSWARTETVARSIIVGSMGCQGLVNINGESFDSTRV